MNKECEHTRRSLRKYLHGHLFMPEQMKIERHLKKCVVCSSEFQALKRAAETRRYMKDITPPEGMVQRVKAGVSGLSRLKKILYRPLWVAGIIVVVALVYFYAQTPHRYDGELEGTGAPLDTTTQPLPAAASPSRAAAKATAKAPVEPEKTVPAPSPGIEPLVITISVDDEQAATRRINEVMRGHATLRSMRFSDTVKEISGSLTAKELLTFFNRIENAGKVNYSRTRLASFPAAAPVPFVMRLKTEQRPAEPPIQQSREKPAVKTGDTPVEKPAPPAAPAQ
ncbi:MAG: hypothetical protein A2Z46_05845 [Nitrospirae bacterium RBG_19FT_COMBO_55_12]|nr:MAG: hypothetical protein A2Z46_05845 [Nitrospirae bacterium RBG_19FT_COMBO_55_12]